MTAVKIVIATVLLLASASPMQAGEAGNEICPPGFNEMFNVNEPGCTFCSAPSECQVSCLGPPACFCEPGNTACCADNPCCTNCPEPKPLQCSTSSCICEPSTCCSTVCPDTTRAPAASTGGIAALAAVLAGLGMITARARRRRQ